MKAYKYFFSETLTPVQRCCDLMSKAFSRFFAGPLCGEEGSARPGVYACMVDAGSEAVPGNLGCDLIRNLRDSIDSGTNAYLSPEEVTEIQAFFAQEEEVDVGWWWGP
jgi:hypothetical protein